MDKDMRKHTRNGEVKVSKSVQDVKREGPEKETLLPEIKNQNAKKEKSKSVQPEDEKNLPPKLKSLKIFNDAVLLVNPNSDCSE